MSRDGFSPLKQLCKRPDCGHDKDTHHQGKHNCLGTYCDCHRYVDPYKDEPPTERVIKAAPPSFDPFEDWDPSWVAQDITHPDLDTDDGCPSTWPMFPASTPRDPP